LNRSASSHERSLRVITARGEVGFIATAGRQAMTERGKVSCLNEQTNKQFGRKNLVSSDWGKAPNCLCTGKKRLTQKGSQILRVIPIC